MLLIYLVLGSVMLFQSGMFWSAYKIDLIDGKIQSKMHYWSAALAVGGLYFLISMIGRAAQL